MADVEQLAVALAEQPRELDAIAEHIDNDDVTSLAMALGSRPGEGSAATSSVMSVSTTAPIWPYPRRRAGEGGCAACGGSAAAEIGGLASSGASTGDGSIVAAVLSRSCSPGSAGGAALSAPSGSVARAEAALLSRAARFMGPPNLETSILGRV